MKFSIVFAPFKLKTKLYEGKKNTKQDDFLKIIIIHKHKIN